LDIYAEVGGYTALKKTVTTTVNDDNLSIEFDHIEENPKVSVTDAIRRWTETQRSLCFPSFRFQQLRFMKRRRQRSLTLSWHLLPLHQGTC